VLDGRIVQRQGKELYIDLARLARPRAGTLRQIALSGATPDDFSLTAMNACMDNQYHQLTHPYPTLQALLKEHSYRNNPGWTAIPVDSSTFHRRRILHTEQRPHNRRSGVLFHQQ
jgi:hypothetical protein